ncbi:MAG: lysophospholipase [Caryophanon sp.]|nr:lysophospholipase [Caryophanon sp.]
MKKWRIAVLCSCFILTGCSVSIDPADEEASYYPETFNEWQQLQVHEKEQELKEQQVHKPEEAVPLIEPQPGQELFYLALGDSLTRGIGDEENRYGWTGRLAEQMRAWPTITNVELDNRGKNGRRSDQLLKLLEKGHYDDQLAKADLLSISIGGNDVMKVIKKDLFSLNTTKPFDEELEAYRERYEDILAYIRAHNADAPLIILGFYNPFTLITDQQNDFNEVMDRFNSVMEAQALQDVNACFVPVEDLFLTNDDLVYHTDFFHPNAQGYDNMTNRAIVTLELCNIQEMSDGQIGFERMMTGE